MDARVRISIWKIKTRTHIAVAAFPISLSLRSEKGFHATVSCSRRNRTKYSHLKTLYYQECYDAAVAAERKNFDEAVLLNDWGQLVECSRSNIFIVKDRKIFTPDIASGCLQGITRAIVMMLARKKRIFCREAGLGPEELWNADEVFLTNAVIGVVPLIKVDGRPVASGKAGPLTKRMRSAYRRFRQKGQ